MTPIEQAKAWHAGSGCEWEFRDLIEAHGRVGYVIATPELFLLARRVRVCWPAYLRNNPLQVANDGGCWHVWLIAGDWTGWERFLPYPLPFVSMHRRGVLRVYRLDRFRRLKWRVGRSAGDASGNGKQGAETEGSTATATGPDDGGRGTSGEFRDVGGDAGFQLPEFVSGG